MYNSRVEALAGTSNVGARICGCIGVGLLMVGSLVWPAAIPAVLAQQGQSDMRQAGRSGQYVEFDSVGQTRSKLEYPASRRVQQIDAYHGVRITDSYRWLEAMDSEEVVAWTRAQDAFTQSYVKDVPDRAALRERILALQQFDRYGLPTRADARYFWSVARSGLANPVTYVQEGLDGEPRVVLDPAVHPAFETEGARVGWTTPSPDGRRLMFNVGPGQSRWRTTYVLDVDAGRTYNDALTGAIGGVAWDQSGEGFYYARYAAPAPGKELSAQLVNAKIYYHRVGTGQEIDELVYENPDEPTWSYTLQVTFDGSYLVISATPGGSFSGMVEHVLVRELRDPQAEFRELFVGVDGTFGYEGNRGSRFLIRTSHEAPNARLLEVDIDDAPNDPATWREVIPEAPDVLNTISVSGDYLVARYSRDARPLIRIFSWDGDYEYDLELPNLGSVNGLGDVYEGPETFLSMNILYDPGINYRVDLTTGQTTVFRSPDLPYDPSDFEAKQVFYTSADGTKVPMYVIHRKGITLNGQNAVFMYGYGAYGWVAWPWFQPPLVAWLEMGGVYALPNIRGGGEYGEAWHQDGIRTNKQNGIDDYVAAAAWLIDKGYTSSSRMIANGGSASGALAAAAMMQRPDLFGAAIIDIPNLDLLRSHTFPGGANRVAEYGSSDDPDEFTSLYAYSPYHNIRRGTCYPPTLVTVGSRDEVAVPLHGYKYVAAMQSNQECDSPVLLNVVWGGGHGYGLNPEQTADTWATIFAFLQRSVGGVGMRVH